MPPMKGIFPRGRSAKDPFWTGMAGPSASSLLNSGNSRGREEMPIIYQYLVTIHGFQTEFREPSIMEPVDRA
jgi:hypothetical protein